jgi:hypothetical protein
VRSFYIEKALRAEAMRVLSKSAGGVCIRYREAATWSAVSISQPIKSLFHIRQVFLSLYN